MAEPQYQVTYAPRRTNHILHLLLSLVTIGLWIPIWILIAVVNGVRAPEQTSWTETHTTAAPPPVASASTPLAADERGRGHGILIGVSLGVVLGTIGVFLAYKPWAPMFLIVVSAGVGIWAYLTNRLF